ncbi:hypothetical protein FRZ67_05700 [Panacibacter ginsenosidivorans]|uniref:YfhO family protein n=1 Tax=Panacibacter ginsenosidivorans TaxID=1813871 RepID=A0A5B8V7N8_9BACT|nr:hypothetical protein [Panacibacter ginsenosidivorans]QEC66821.1 hypothetical protein FRZ67_05700 [Panacibacter ginsenosidivorans]
MREIFTDKNYITGKLIFFAKLLLIVALIIFFAPLFILPFFNHPCADDYICGYHLNTKGFWEYQQFIYNNWGGRFAATFTGSLFAKNNYLYDHYYMHSILLLLLNILSVFFMITVANKYVLKDEHLKKNIVWVCLLYTSLQVCCLVEPSTYIFWFSSAITYQLPVILLQLQLGLWIMVMHTDKAFTKYIAYILLPLMVIIVNGFNELFIIAQAVLLLVVFLSGAGKRISKIFIAIVLLCFVASALVVVLSPGIQSRTAIIEPKGILVGGVAMGYHVAESLWSICMNPFAWFAMSCVFLFGNYRREKLKDLHLIKVFLKRRWLLPAVIVLFLLVAVGIAVTGLKGGVIPDRYINGITSISVTMMLLIAFTEGIALNNFTIKIFSQPVQLFMIIIFFISLLANNYLRDAYKSLIAAPLYDAVMDDRESSLKKAALNKQPAVLESYNNSMQQHLQNEYGHSTKTLYDLVQQKPSFIFFEDDLATEYSIETLKNFYGVDSIIVK